MPSSWLLSLQRRSARETRRWRCRNIRLKSLPSASRPNAFEHSVWRKKLKPASARKGRTRERGPRALPGTVALRRHAQKFNRTFSPSHDLCRRFSHRHGFLSHLRSLKYHMFTAQQYREKTTEYEGLLRTAHSSGEASEFRELNRTSLFQIDKPLISLSFVEGEGRVTGYDPG
jgi:hypothetical protein